MAQRVPYSFWKPLYLQFFLAIPTARLVLVKGACNQQTTRNTQNTGGTQACYESTRNANESAKAPKVLRTSETWCMNYRRIWKSHQNTVWVHKLMPTAQRMLQTKLQCMSMYYKLVQSTTKYNNVLHSIPKYYEVLQCITKNYNALQSTTK